MKNSDTIQYKLIKTTAQVEDSGLVATYGICCRVDKQISEQHEVSYQVIKDISCEPRLVEDLIAKLYQHDVDPLHLPDLIEDHLP